MEMPDFVTDGAQVAWLNEQHQKQMAHDRSYRFAADVGEVASELRPRGIYEDEDIGAVDVYILKDIDNRPMAYLGISRFDEDDPSYDKPSEDDDMEWDDSPLVPDYPISTRLQSFPFGKMPKTHRTHWRLDQLRTGVLEVTLFRDGVKHVDISRREEVIKEALRTIEDFSV